MRTVVSPQLSGRPPISARRSSQPVTTRSSRAAASSGGVPLPSGSWSASPCCIEAQPEDCEPPLDPAWLADHGYGPSEVCISRMALAGEVRGQGLSHVLKRAQLTAAGDAGYRALASPWGNSITQAIARRAGGLVQTASMSGWVLIPVQTAGVKAQEVPGMLRS